MLASDSDSPSELPSFIRSACKVEVRNLRTGAAGHLAWQARALVNKNEPSYELSRLRVVDLPNTRATLAGLFASHDVAWFLDKHAAFLVRSVLGALPVPSLLDIGELVAHRCRQEIALLDATKQVGPSARLEAKVRRLFLERNERAWNLWTHTLASGVTINTVAKEDDVKTLSQHRVQKIPNGCSVSGRKVRLAARAHAPVLIFHGLMNYSPNVDGARFLVGEVLPRLEREIGNDFVIRIVGKPAPEVTALMKRDSRVTVTGYVDDIRAELTRADIVVVPLRMGSGTRIKILDAFAECVPVVSTTLGCEGLGVRDGEHLLIADDAATFANACRRILEDQELRLQLTDRAYRLVAERFDWSAIESNLAQLARDMSAR